MSVWSFPAVVSGSSLPGEPLAKRSRPLSDAFRTPSCEAISEKSELTVAGQKAPKVTRLDPPPMTAVRSPAFGVRCLASRLWDDMEELVPTELPISVLPPASVVPLPGGISSNRASALRQVDKF